VAKDTGEHPCWMATPRAELFPLGERRTAQPPGLKAQAERRPVTEHLFPYQSLPGANDAALLRADDDQIIVQTDLPGRSRRATMHQGYR
jgi:hypothetical protein